jgi:HEPN domain-containing protein
MNVHDEVHRWLNYAREDLQVAQSILDSEDSHPRHVCWLAQQAVEKALKSVLIFSQIDFPFTHDLDRLRNLLPEGWQVKANFPDFAELTQWAVEARYPSDMPEASADDAQRAAKQANAVLETVTSDLKKHSLGNN